MNFQIQIIKIKKIVIYYILFFKLFYEITYNMKILILDGGRERVPIVYLCIFAYYIAYGFSK